MDKTDLRNKRRSDKQHKKVPPPKPGKQTDKPKAPEVQHTAPLIVCDYRYGKRQIVQNWTEDNDLPPADGSEFEDDQVNAADFEKLLSVPPSTSGHFLLSSEKHWLDPEPGLLGEDQKNRYSEYFNIDTKLLNAGVGCIPFYERLGYDEALFSASELNLMRQKAEIQTATYNKLCKERSTKPDGVSNKENMPLPAAKPNPVPCLVGKQKLPKSVSEDATVPSSKDTAQPSTAEKTKSIESDMRNLKISAPVAVPVASVPVASTPVETPTATPINPSQAAAKDTKEDIQQWLDDILEI